MADIKIPCKPMMNNIVSWWADYTANGLPYVLTLRTQPRADMLVITFQQVLESVPGIVSLTERSSGGGITEMMIKFKGNSVQLKREILSSLPGHTLKISSSFTAIKIPTPLTVKFINTICQSGPNFKGSCRSALIFAKKPGFANPSSLVRSWINLRQPKITSIKADIITNIDPT